MEVSRVSTYEFVSLIAKYNSLEQSTTIDPRLLDRGFTPEQLDALKSSMQLKNNSMQITSLGVRITGDPSRFKLQEFDYISTLYSVYSKSGALPYPGSTSEQPARIMEMFNILEQLTSERQQKDLSRRDKESRKNGRH